MRPRGRRFSKSLNDSRWSHQASPQKLLAILRPSIVDGLDVDALLAQGVHFLQRLPPPFGHRRRRAPNRRSTIAIAVLHIVPRQFSLQESVQRHAIGQSAFSTRMARATSSDTKRISSASVISVSIFSAPPSSRSAASWRLLVDQGVDRLLDRAAADELVDQHVALLADAEGPVGGLVLDGRVPPAVEVDHVRGGGQVQARAAGLQRQDEERRAVVALELVDERLAPSDGRAAVQHQARAGRRRRARKPASGSVISRNCVKTSAFSCREAISSQISASRANLPLSSGAIAAVAQQLAGVVAELLEPHQIGQHQAAPLHAVDALRARRPVPGPAWRTARPAACSGRRTPGPRSSRAGRR